MLQLATPIAAAKFPLQSAMEHDPVGAAIAYYASCLDQHPTAIAAVERLLGMTPPEFRFTRRGFREASGWTDNQLRVHFQRLIDLELLRVHRGRQGCTYLYELVT